MIHGPPHATPLNSSAASVVYKIQVLDRPNPLGGEKVDGPFLDTKWKSYVGAYEMPYVHGLTIGEIAQWAVATPGVLDLSEGQRKNAQLEVISLTGWLRSKTLKQKGKQRREMKKTDEGKGRNEKGTRQWFFWWGR